jgi:hypothetical protein
MFSKANHLHQCWGIDARRKASYKCSMSGRIASHIPPRNSEFSSATQACRYLLQNALSPAGRFIPLTAADVTFQLLKQGFFLSQRDVEGLLRELAVAGDAVEIDAAAGFRWNGRVA